MRPAVTFGTTKQLCPHHEGAGPYIHRNEFIYLFIIIINKVFNSLVILFITLWHPLSHKSSCACKACPVHPWAITLPITFHYTKRTSPIPTCCLSFSCSINLQKIFYWCILPSDWNSIPGHTARVPPLSHGVRFELAIKLLPAEGLDH